MSTTEMTAEVSGETCRPWISSGRIAWAICVGESILLDGEIDEPDDRSDAELVEALIEAGVESPNDQARLVAFHRENVWGIHAVGYES